MWIYLICFACSVWFAYRAQKSRSKRRFVFFSIISIAITVILAGLRDISVGIDTYNYYRNGWAVAVNSKSLGSFLKAYYNSWDSKEYLYALLLGSAAKMSGDYHVFLTIVHLIIIGGVYIGVFRLREYASPAFMLLTFYLLFYNHSLNVYRQYMALAILFASTADILHRRYLRYLLFTFIAVLIHNSAVIGILPLIIFALVYPHNNYRLIISSFTRIDSKMHSFTPVQTINRTVIFLMIVIGVAGLLPFMRLLIDIGLLSRKYLFYVSSDSTNTYIVARVLLLAEVLIIILFKDSFSGQKNEHFFIICTLTYFTLYQLAPSIPYGKRIPAYFSLINLTSLGILTQSQHIRFNRVIIKYSIVLVVVAYWFFFYAYSNASQTIPYVLGV